MDTQGITRRDALKVAAFGAAALALPLSVPLAAQATSQLTDAKYLTPYVNDFVYPAPAVAGTRGGKDYYRLEQRMFDAEILPGLKTTKVFGYGQVVNGSFRGQVPGPTIIARRGQETIVRQRNNLPYLHPTLGYQTWTSTHLHGSPSQAQYDGYAGDITKPNPANKVYDPAAPQQGEWKDYHYPNTVTARTLWYHDHGVHHTAQNVYMGLAALYICTDPAAKYGQYRDERGGLADVVLPSVYGSNDFPLVISDKAFTRDGQLLYDDNDHSGVFGDVITVNGKAWPKMQVRPGVYRFRFLNASVSRGYSITFGDNRPMALVGTDAGLVPNVKRLTTFRLGMGERYEIVVEFTAQDVGTTVDLLNKGVPNSIDYANTGKIMRFQVVAATAATNVQPQPGTAPQNPAPTPMRWLADGQPLYAQAAAMDLAGRVAKGAPIAAKRTLELSRQNGQWTIGPFTWAQVVESGYDAAYANPQPGTIEQWTVVNKSVGSFHPVHIHLVDFQVVSRSTDGGTPLPWEHGGKDVVYVGENEQVTLLMEFPAGAKGRYMIHCHNLTHEDSDMMTQFVVGAEKRTATFQKSPGVPYTDIDGIRILDKGGQIPVYDPSCDAIYAAHPTTDPET
jgi:spore coat protein A